MPENANGNPAESAAAQPTNRAVGLVIVVAALGYFVDIFDLLLFALVRKASLTEVMAAELAGKPEAEVTRILTENGVWLDNILQTTGLLVGGLVWGVIADRRGRLSVLFGSILCYSLANLLNAAVTDVDPQGPLGFLHALGLGSAINQYGVLRFIAGFGLAGELGAGITLVSELVSRERRGLATTFVAAVGILGAVAGYFTTQFVHWRTAFVIGGVLGLALLALRIGVVESGMFLKSERAHVSGRGAFWKLFWPRERLVRWVSTILIAVPIWFVVGTLVKYCDRIMPSLGLTGAEAPTAAKAIMWCYVGLALGDLSSGLAGQWMKSRRKSIALFHVLTVLAMVLYFTVAPKSQFAFYGRCLQRFLPSNSAQICARPRRPWRRTLFVGRRRERAASGSGCRARRWDSNRGRRQSRLRRSSCRSRCSRRSASAKATAPTLISTRSSRTPRPRYTSRPLRDHVKITAGIAP